MAEFSGTIKDFTRFIGPYARIKVNLIASKHKIAIGCCEFCGITTQLEAAHIKGKERPVLISEILSEFLDEDIVRIDLYQFVDRFIESHQPFETTIKILCKSCHRDYDKKNTQKGEVSDISNMREESSIIEDLIIHQMNKSKALKLCLENGFKNFSNSNTIFSNIISIQKGWWLQPSNDKFEEELHIILHDDRQVKLHIFSIPAGAIVDPSKYFKQRNDKHRANCSDVYIPTDGIGFKEKGGFDFTRFKVDTITYNS